MKDRLRRLFPEYRRSSSGPWHSSPPAICFAIVCVTTVLTGCNSSLSGSPHRVFTTTDEFMQAKQTYGAESISAYHAALGPRKTQLRNQITLGRMYAIDIAFSEFESELTQERQRIPFAMTTASIALSGTGALIADSVTKSILAAVDTGLKGTKEAYDKDILVQRTIENLQKSMRTNRNIIKSRILTNLNRPNSVYPLELALSDVEDYYRAGTITAGLIGISEKTSVQLATSEAFKVDVISTPFDPSEACEQLTSFLNSDPAGTSAQKPAKVFRDWLAKNYPSLKDNPLTASNRPEVCAAFVATF